MTPLVLLSLFITADPAVKPVVPVGKTTTFFDGPLTAEGDVDFEAALNAKLGAGVTPAKNVVAGLRQALGPIVPHFRRLPKDYYKALGIDEPADGGAYWISQEKFLVERMMTDEWREFDKVRTTAAVMPWTAAQYPLLAEYLKGNQKAFAAISEASQRPDYFQPHVARDEKTGTRDWLAGARTGTAEMEEVAIFLGTRAMLRLGEKNTDAAWEDARTLFRLVRHYARGGTLAEREWAFSVHQFATDIVLRCVEHGHLTAVQAATLSKEFAVLAGPISFAESVDVSMRVMALDFVSYFRRGLYDTKYERREKPLTEPQLKGLAAVDYTPVMTAINVRYDTLTAVLKKDRAERIAGVLKFIETSYLESRDRDNPGPREQFVIDLDITGTAKLRYQARQLHRVASGLSMGPVHAMDRCVVRGDYIRLSFALAAFKADTGAYPKTLADLVPKYTPEIPPDRFTGKPLTYEVTADGYRIACVGVWGEGDPTRWQESKQTAAPMTITMPYVPPKAEK